MLHLCSLDAYKFTVAVNRLVAISTPFHLSITISIRITPEPPLLQDRAHRYNDFLTGHYHGQPYTHDKNQFMSR